MVVRRRTDAPLAQKRHKENCMYFVYVLQSISNLTRYVGQTDNVNKRLREHNSGKCRYSSGKRPWKLIYQEEYKSRSEAIKRERFLKSGQGRKYLDEVLKNKFGEVAEWSKAARC